jgi:hypothetical protein
MYDVAIITILLTVIAFSTAAIIRLIRSTGPDR